ncbi:DsbE family thiol:disulfide interchange protein [Pseudomonadota bacterium]
MTDKIETATIKPNPAKIKFLMPLIVFLTIAVFLGIGLSLNPREIPSPLIGKPVPEFDLPAVQGRNLPLSSKALKGEVSLVNIFASWCVACVSEHPLLLKLQQQKRVPIHGINYKDQQKDAAQWLDKLGDPYTMTGADVNGRVGIDWGVYGVPETFVIDKQGRIAYKQIGPVTAQILQEKIIPLVEKLQKL